MDHRTAFARLTLVLAGLVSLAGAATPASAGLDTGKVMLIMEEAFRPTPAQVTEFQRILGIERAAIAAEEEHGCLAAEPLHRQVFEAKRALIGLRRSITLNSLVNIARCQATRGDFAAALKTREREWDERGWTVGTHADATVGALRWMKMVGEQALRQGQPTGILAPLGRAYAQLFLVDAHDLNGIPRDARPSTVSAAIAAYDLGRSRDGGGDVRPAMLLLEAVLLQQWTLGKDAQLTLAAMSRYAEGLAARGRTMDARYIAFTLAERADRELGPGHPDSIRYRLQLAGLARDAGDRDAALSHARAADQQAAAHLPPSHPVALLARFHRLAAAGAGSGAQDTAAMVAAAEALFAERGRADRDSLQVASLLAQSLIEAGEPERAAQVASRTATAAREDGSIYMLETARFEEAEGLARLHIPAQRHTAHDFIDGSQVGSRMAFEVATYSPGTGDELDAALADLGQSSRLALDSLWLKLRHEGGARDGWIDQQVFTYMQETMRGGAAGAISEKAAIRAMERLDPQLGRLARQRRDLTERWRALDERVIVAIASEGSTSEAGVALLREREAIRKRVAEIDEAFMAQTEDYSLIRFPAPAALYTAQERLGPDEAILLIVPTKFASHSLVVTHDAVHWHRSDWTRQRVERAVRGLLMDVGANVEMGDAEYAQWTESRKSPNAFDRGTAYALYTQLVAPHANLLAGKTHLFFAGDGILSSMPLSLLVTQPPRGDDGDPESLRATSWFADDIACVQIPSVSAWAYLRSRGERSAIIGPARFAGFGDPVLDGAAQTRGAATQRRQRGASVPPASAVFIADLRTRGAGVRASDLRALARLPGTAVELEAMRGALGAAPVTVRLREAATETGVKQAQLADIDVLAFATHGLVAGELRGVAEPGLVFTPPAQASEADDGLLTASEVAQLDLAADWVILSACNTAAGDGSEGAAGLSGLASAFFYAGADTLLASHWPVRDDVAARLTVRTIEIARASPGMSKAQAFKQAMREIRQDTEADGPQDSWAHPNAWAPFTLVGDR